MKYEIKVYLWGRDQPHILFWSGSEFDGSVKSERLTCAVAITNSALRIVYLDFENSLA
ncbi:MAG: hypothetical protein ACI9LE_001966 [Paraglaciecola sp.]|jgi:hypothetical protein